MSLAQGHPRQDEEVCAPSSASGGLLFLSCFLCGQGGRFDVSRRTPPPRWPHRGVRMEYVGLWRQSLPLCVLLWGVLTLRETPSTVCSLGLSLNQLLPCREHLPFI